jgi:hypothetical protein
MDQAINIAKNYEICNKSKKVIWLDGMLDNDEITYINATFSHTLSYEIIINTYMNDKNKSYFVYQYKSTFFRSLITELHGGKKLVICTDSRSFV